MSYYSTAKSHKLFNNLKKLYSEFDLKKESVRHKTYNMKNKNYLNYAIFLTLISNFFRIKTDFKFFSCILLNLVFY